MAEFPALSLWTDAYLADTRHLDATEHGAYLLLLMAAWRSTGCCLPNDDVKLARLAACDARTWRKIRANVMSFWTLSDDGNWRQKRLQTEFEFRSRQRKTQSENGRRGGRPKSLKDNDGHKADAFGSLSDRVMPNESQQESDTKPKAKAGEKPPTHTLPKRVSSLRSETPSAAQLLPDAEGVPGCAEARSDDRSEPPSPPPPDGDGTPANRAEHDELEAKLRTAAGLDTAPDPGLLNLAPIYALLRDGFDLDADILPVLRAMAARGAKGRSWRYYTRAIREEREASQAEAAAPPRRANGHAATASPPEPEPDYAAHLADPAKRDKTFTGWFTDGYWPYAVAGPQPGLPGCVVDTAELSAWGRDHGWSAPQVRISVDGAPKIDRHHNGLTRAAG